MNYIINGARGIVPKSNRGRRSRSDTRIATYRESGKTPEEILGFLAASCGWAEKGERVTLHDLLPRFDLGTIPHAPFMI